jgi:ribosomal protein S18 acetylase RimI-like enzyme
VSTAAPPPGRALPDGYRLLDGAPSVVDYLALRMLSGLTPPREDQVAAGIAGAWAAVRVVYEPTGTTVGMGRVVGDGGWYFHVIDMAVLPGHQRRGLGDAVLRALLERIRRDAPPGAWVNLLADGPGRRLYARHGFVATAPDSLGMARLLD